MRHDFREKGERRATRPARTVEAAESPDPGDVVTETRIDRLARSTLTCSRRHRQSIVDAGGQFRSLAEPWADTATSTGRLKFRVPGGRRLYRCRGATWSRPGSRLWSSRPPF